MRRLFALAALSATILFVAPAPAAAYLHWLDEYSGPGPFLGWDLNWRLICLQDPAVDANTRTDPGPSVLRSLNSFSGGKRALVAALGAGGCLLQPNKNPVGSLNLRISELWSKENRLFADTDGGTHRVKIWEFEPTFSVFADPSKFIEVESGIGWSVASGEDFETFTRFYWKPIMVTFTPGAALPRGGHSFLRTVSFATGIRIVPGGFDATDFGAAPGSYHTDREVLGTATVTIDLSRF
jgi:hypothetical protein